MKAEKFLEICRSKAKSDLTEGEQNIIRAFGDAIEQAFTENSAERNQKLADIATKLGMIDEGQTYAGIVRALSAKVDELEAKTKRGLSENDKSVLRSALESKKEDIKKIMRRDTTQSWQLEFKLKRAASAMMTTSTVLTGATAINTDNVFDEMEIELIRYPRNFILDAISSRIVSLVPAVWKWKEEVTAGVGVPTVVTEGSTKPLVDKKFVWKLAERKKYAGRIEMTEEVEMDFQQIVLDVIDMFESEVLRTYNAGVLADILAWAPDYEGTALDGTITRPTVQNVVSAGQLQLAGYNYAGDTLIINPADYAATQNLQNVNGDPIFIPDSALFPGVRLFVTNNITAGTILLGEGSVVKEQHSNYIIRQGVYGNQFIENEKTIVGEIFSVLKLTTESKKGWVKLDFATVKTALQA